MQLRVYLYQVTGQREDYDTTIRRVAIICAKSGAEARMMWDAYRDAASFINVVVREIATANHGVAVGLMVREDFRE